MHVRLATVTSVGAMILASCAQPNGDPMAASTRQLFLNWCLAHRNYDAADNTKSCTCFVGAMANEGVSDLQLAALVSDVTGNSEIAQNLRKMSDAGVSAGAPPMTAWQFIGAFVPTHAQQSLMPGYVLSGPNWERIYAICGLSAE
jgi:hypothetical protein